ncbi:hypothetical protein ACLOJK_029412 [Asimina triloba]
MAATPSYTEEGNAVSSGSLIFLKIVFKAHMTKIQERVFCVPSVSSYGDIRLGEETMGVMEQEQLFKKRDDSCVLDVESLVNATDKDINSLMLQRTLSRKGSQRGEWKSIAQRDPSDAVAGTHVSVCTVENSVGFAAASAESNIPTATTTAENKGRRFLRSSSSINIKRAYWLDPRNVLVAFASL